MNATSRVLCAMGAVTLMTYGSALAQAPAQPPQAPPSAAAPALPPASPSAGAESQSSASSQTATGELVSVDAKANTMTVKTAAGSEVIIKYGDDTKVTGSSRNTAGLATASGSQVVVRYKKDGATNMATNIEVKPAAAASPRPSPGLDSPRPAPGGDAPHPGDDSKPPTPRP